MSRLIAFAAVVLAASFSFAAGKAGEKAPDFPPGLFIDGNHYSLNDLEGKVTVLFFYEKDCPTCRGQIPQRNEVVEAFKGKPVRFIAIAAGDSIQEAKSYVAETHLNMAVFADNLSLMEKRYGFTISLQNIYQFRVIGTTGVVEEYRMEPAAIEKSLTHVKWKYKEGGYDARLAQAIESFEWNQYADGLRLLKPFLKNSKKDLAESAKKLNEAVRAEGQGWLDTAEKAVDAQPVQAFNLYTKTANAFYGEDLAKKAADALKKLQTNPAVKDELAARAMYDKLCAGAGRARPADAGQVAQFAASIAKKYPKTPTGMKAEEIAKEMGVN